MASSYTSSGSLNQRPNVVDSAVNKPVNFSTGVFAGRTIRVELEEIQNAELGRKYARKDKRPLDPPPVVLCRFFEVFRSVSNAESEMDPMQASFGAICHADLFPVPSTNQHPFLLPALPSIRPPSTATVAAHALIPSSAGSGVVDCSLQHTTALTASRATVLSGLATDSPSRVIGQANQKPDVVAWFGSHAICESDKWTNMLAGGSSVHASIIKYQGRESAMFVFPDLSVRAEGTFVLRFRVSCVFSGPACQGASHPILAECFGRPFEIFPTKGFPGLGASTALTKNIALHGVRVPVRDRKRKRSQKLESDASTEGSTGSPGIAVRTYSPLRPGY